MGEEFQGGVCGGTWWTPPHNLFSGGLSSPCSVAQLGGGGGAFDMGNLGWQNEVIKGKLNNNQVFDNNFILPYQMDSSFDTLGFALSPTSSTTDWNHHQNLICNNNGSSEGNFDSILQDNLNNNSSLSCYDMGENSSNIMISTNFCNNPSNNVDHQQSVSPPMALTASSNSSGDSSSITYEGGGLATSLTTDFSSTSYLIQSLFDDLDECQVVLEPQSTHNNNNNNNQYINTSNNFNNPTINQSSIIPSQLQLVQDSNKIHDGMMNALINGGDDGQVLNSGQYSQTTLNNIRASLLNSLQSRSRGVTSLNQKSHSCVSKVNGEENCREIKNKNDQPSAKRPRIETPSPLPTFKVRKEKLGDRITALQQLVSPFGKTDTASVLHEAIEYIKFLHDQVNVLSTPYLKSGSPMQQQGCEKIKEKEDGKQDLRSRGLCLAPISSTYPVAQETPVDFWTPTFGGTTFR